MSTVTIAQLGIQVDATSVDKAAASLDKLPAAGGRAETAVTKVGKAGKEAAAALNDNATAAQELERRIDALKGSIDPTYSAMKRLDAELAEANALYKIGALSANDYARAVGVLEGRTRSLINTQGASGKALGSTGKAAGLARHELQNLSYQLNDIGVSLASGQNPLIVLTQQGSQIGQIFAGSGAGAGAIIAQFGGILGGVLAVAAPLVVTLGGAAAAFGLMNHELQKGFPKDITDGLGLTADQLDKVTSKTVTTGDVFKATLKVMGGYLTDGPIGDALEWLGNAWTSTMDFLANVAFEGTARTLGFFVGSYRAIVANWRNFPAVLGDIFTFAANTALDNVERLVNGAVAGLNVIFGMARQLPGLSWLPVIPEADLSRFKGQISGAAEFLGMAVGAAVGQATDDVRAGLRKIGVEISAEALKIAQARAREEAGDAKASKARKASADAAIREIKLVSANLADFAKVPRKVTDEIHTMHDLVRGDIENLKQSFEFEADQMADALNGVTDALGGILSALRSGDWGTALSRLGVAFKGLANNVGGTFSNIFSVAGSAIGSIGAAGQLGQTLGLGTGNAKTDLGLTAIGGLGGLALAYSPLSAGIAGAVTSGALGLGAGAGFAGSLGAMMSSAAALGPIGVIVALGLGSLLKDKPTNAGAGVALTPTGLGEITGNKRTADTEAAATGTAKAILAGEQTLRDLGATLEATVRGLVVGTRDPSQIYLTNGQTLTAAVGDTAAAAETALKAVLEGAKFTDDAQQKLADKMLAAGAGFDDIIAALGNLKAAMNEATAFGQAVGDRIAELQNPSLYSVNSLASSQSARYSQLDAYLAGGALTQSQYDAQKAQLATLDGLEMASLMADLTDQLGDFSSATTDAASNAQAAAAQFGAIARTLRDYAGDLSGSLASNASPLTEFARAQSAFRAIENSRNPADLEKMRTLGQAYVDAAQRVAPDGRTLARVMGEVRSKVSDAAGYAEDKASIAEQQLDALKDINKTVAKDSTLAQVGAAITALGTRLVQNQVTAQGAPFTETPSWFDVNKYIADNKDLKKNWDNGGILTTIGASSFEEAAMMHFLRTGQFEIAAGNRKYADGTDYAAGGWSLVGERGPELLRLPRGSQVVPNNTLARMASGGSDAGLRAELAALRREMASVLHRIAEASEGQKYILTRATRDGEAFVTIPAAA